MVNKGSHFADFVRLHPCTYTRTQQSLRPLWAAMKRYSPVQFSVFVLKQQPRKWYIFSTKTGEKICSKCKYHYIWNANKHARIEIFYLNSIKIFFLNKHRLFELYKAFFLNKHRLFELYKAFFVNKHRLFELYKAFFLNKRGLFELY